MRAGLVVGILLTFHTTAFAEDVGHPIIVTVTTKVGSVYHGELVERVVGRHVVVRIATGATRLVPWSELAPNQWPPREPAVVETIRTKRGDVFRGELIERVDGDRVVLKMATGEIRRIGWDELVQPAEAADVELTVKADAPRTILQRVDPITLRFVDVCDVPCSNVVAAPSGTYRLTGAALVPTSTFPIVAGHANVIDAEMGRRLPHTAGTWLTVVGAAFVTGSPFAFGAAVATESQANRNAFIAIGVPLAFIGVTLVAVGTTLLVHSRSEARHVIVPLRSE